MGGYRIFDGDVLTLLAFVPCARRLGFRLAEIREIVALRRAGKKRPAFMSAR